MRTTMLAIISVLSLTAIDVVASVPATYVESALAAGRAPGMTAGQKEAMKKCNANSADCNHKCEFTYRSGVFSKTGLGNCQDKCDTKFANCVGNVGPD